MGLLEIFGWTLMVAGMLNLIFLSLKDKSGQPLPTRRSAIGAALGALGGMIMLAGFAVDHDTGGVLRYAIFLTLLAILVLAVSKRRADA